MKSDRLLLNVLCRGRMTASEIVVQPLNAAHARVFDRSCAQLLKPFNAYSRAGCDVGERNPGAIQEFVRAIEERLGWLWHCRSLGKLLPFRQQVTLYATETRYPVR